MARDSSGNYTLPAGNPVTAGTTIEVSWANPTMSDIATEIQNSLDRQGRGGMSGALKLADGTEALPGLSFVSDPDTGLRRVGDNAIALVCLSADVVDITTAGIAVTGTLSTTGALTVTAGGLTVTAGGLTVTAGGASITGDSTITGNLDVTSGVDVTGNVIATGIIRSNSNPSAGGFTGTEANGGFRLYTTNGDGTTLLAQTDDAGTYEEAWIGCTRDGSVNLNYNGSETFRTVLGGVSVTGDIGVSGTVDGRDVATDGTKLDGIESGATADQTGAEIKTALFAEANTNNFDDAAQTKLAGIESGATADQSAAEILAALLTVDGSGSGLDADLLDGVELSNIARTDQSSEIFSGIVRTNTLSSLGGFVGTEAAGGFRLFSTNSNGTTILAQTDSGGTYEEPWLLGERNGSVYIYYNGAQKFKSVSTGVSVTGDIILPADNAFVYYGASNDFNMGFDGTNFYIRALVSDTNDIVFLNTLGFTKFLFDISSGDFHAGGDIIAFSTSVGSDARLKDNIQYIEDALSILENFEGATFNMKRDGRPSAGVIAQDILPHFPCAVSKQATLQQNEEYYSVNYNAIIGLLISAVNQLNRRIEEML